MVWNGRETTDGFVAAGLSLINVNTRTALVIAARDDDGCKRMNLYILPSEYSPPLLPPAAADEEEAVVTAGRAPSATLGVFKS